MWVALVPSGMDWLDTEIGGLPAAGVVAAIGPAGTGKTSLALGFALAQLRRQQSVCYLTSETPEAVLETCRGMMEQDLRPHIASGHLTLLSFSPFFVNKVRSLNSNDPPLAELQELVGERRIQHIVIDTLDPMLSWIDGANAKAFVRTMLGQIQTWGRSVMCTMTGNAPAAAELARTASGSFELAEEKLIVRHAGWCNVYDIEAPLAFVQGRGLVVRANAGRGKPAAKAAMSDMSLIAAAPLLPDSERKPNLGATGNTGAGEHKPWMSLIGDANKLLGAQAAAVLIKDQPRVSTPQQSHAPPPVHPQQGSERDPLMAPMQPMMQQPMGGGVSIHAPMSVSPATPRLQQTPPGMPAPRAHEPQPMQPSPMPPQVNAGLQPVNPMAVSAMAANAKAAAAHMQQQQQQHEQRQHHALQRPPTGPGLPASMLPQVSPSPLHTSPHGSPFVPAAAPVPAAPPAAQTSLGGSSHPAGIAFTPNANANANANANPMNAPTMNERPKPQPGDPYARPQAGVPDPSLAATTAFNKAPARVDPSLAMTTKYDKPSPKANPTGSNPPPANNFGATMGPNVRLEPPRIEVKGLIDAGPPSSSKTIVTESPALRAEEEGAPASVEDPTRILPGASQVALGPALPPLHNNAGNKSVPPARPSNRPIPLPSAGKSNPPRR